MIKYSVIVPVYNAEKYLEKCLDSIINQSFDNFELILVNDGSNDKSLHILKDYAKKDKRIILIDQKNQGVSSARNRGISEAKGEYLMFVDSDDYIDLKTLEIIDKSTNGVDIIRFQFVEVDNFKETAIPEEGFEKMSGDEAFIKILKYKYRETAVSYAYKRDFFIKEKFAFTTGRYHEDYGLIPLLIMKASSVVSISDCLYYYVNNEESIMNTKDEQSMYKKYIDTYVLCNNAIKAIDQTKLKNKDVFKSFLVNALLSNLIKLDKQNYKEELKKLKKDKIFDNLLSDNLMRKIKKLVVSINPKLVYRNKEKR